MLVFIHDRVSEASQISAIAKRDCQSTPEKICHISLWIKNLDNCRELNAYFKVGHIINLFGACFTLSTASDTFVISLDN